MLLLNSHEFLRAPERISSCAWATASKSYCRMDIKSRISLRRYDFDAVAHAQLEMRSGARRNSCEFSRSIHKWSREKRERTTRTLSESEWSRNKRQGSRGGRFGCGFRGGRGGGRGRGFFFFRFLFQIRAMRPFIGLNIFEAPLAVTNGIQ